MAIIRSSLEFLSNVSSNDYAAIPPNEFRVTLKKCKILHKKSKAISFSNPPFTRTYPRALTCPHLTTSLYADPLGISGETGVGIPGNRIRQSSRDRSTPSRATPATLKLCQSPTVAPGAPGWQSLSRKSGRSSWADRHACAGRERVRESPHLPR